MKSVIVRSENRGKEGIYAKDAMDRPANKNHRPRTAPANIKTPLWNTTYSMQQLVSTRKSFCNEERILQASQTVSNSSKSLIPNKAEHISSSTKKEVKRQFIDDAEIKLAHIHWKQAELESKTAHIKLKQLQYEYDTKYAAKKKRVSVEENKPLTNDIQGQKSLQVESKLTSALSPTANKHSKRNATRGIQGVVVGNASKAKPVKPSTKDNKREPNQHKKLNETRVVQKDAITLQKITEEHTSVPNQNESHLAQVLPELNKIKSVQRDTIPSKTITGEHESVPNQNESHLAQVLPELNKIKSVQRDTIPSKTITGEYESVPNQNESHLAQVLPELNKIKSVQRDTIPSKTITGEYESVPNQNESHLAQVLPELNKIKSVQRDTIPSKTITGEHESVLNQNESHFAQVLSELNKTKAVQADTIPLQTTKEYENIPNLNENCLTPVLHDLNKTLTIETDIMQTTEEHEYKPNLFENLLTPVLHELNKTQAVQTDIIQTTEEHENKHNLYENRLTPVLHNLNKTQAVQTDIIQTTKEHEYKPQLYENHLAQVLTELDTIKSLPTCTDNARDVCVLASSVHTSVQVIKSFKKAQYLYSLETVRSLIGKLPNILKWRCYDYIMASQAEDKYSDLSLISEYLDLEASKCAPFASFGDERREHNSSASGRRKRKARRMK